MDINHKMPAKIIMHPESKFAHKLLDGLRGIEIGASSYSPFGLKTLNVDFSDDPNGSFQKVQIKYTGLFI